MYHKYRSKVNITIPSHIYRKVLQERMPKSRWGVSFPVKLGSYSLKILFVK
jgi:hypothetical protein